MSLESTLIQIEHVCPRTDCDVGMHVGTNQLHKTSFRVFSVSFDVITVTNGLI
jgi:hypothetical protein